MNKNNDDLSGEQYSELRNRISQIILDMYLPAANEAETEDYIAMIEILEAVRSLIEVESEYVLSIMIELGFKTKNIEGNIYWMVKGST